MTPQDRYIATLLVHRDTDSRKPLSPMQLALAGFIATRAFAYDGELRGEVKLGYGLLTKHVGGRKGGVSAQRARRVAEHVPSEKTGRIGQGLNHGALHQAGRGLIDARLLKMTRRPDGEPIHGTRFAKKVCHWLPVLTPNAPTADPQWPGAFRAALALLQAPAAVGGPDLTTAAVRAFFAANADGLLIGRREEIAEVLGVSTRRVVEVLKRLVGIADNGITEVGRKTDSQDARVKHFAVRCQVPARAFGARYAAIRALDRTGLVRALWHKKEVGAVLKGIGDLRPDGITEKEGLEILREVVAEQARLEARYREADLAEVQNLLGHAIGDFLDANPKHHGAFLVKEARREILADPDHMRWLWFIGARSADKGTLNRAAPHYIPSLRAAKAVHEVPLAA